MSVGFEPLLIGQEIEFMSRRTGAWTRGRISMGGVDDFYVVGIKDTNDMRVPYLVDEGETWRRVPIVEEAR